VERAQPLRRALSAVVWWTAVGVGMWEWATRRLLGSNGPFEISKWIGPINIIQPFSFGDLLFAPHIYPHVPHEITKTNPLTF
jgi:hypothetical protein